MNWNGYYSANDLLALILAIQAVLFWLARRHTGLPYFASISAGLVLASLAWGTWHWQGVGRPLVDWGWFWAQPLFAGGVMIIGVALSLYLLVVALASGYAFAYARGLMASPVEFLTQVAGALHVLDFPLSALKTAIFGTLIGLVICYQGLARPLSLADVGAATTRTVAVCGVGCLLVDAAFIALYLLL